MRSGSTFCGFPLGALAAALLLPSLLSAQEPSETRWTTHHRFDGTTDNEHYGWAVAGQVDFDLDGYDDILIGSDGYDGPAGEDAGAVFLFSGKTGSLIRRFDGAIAGGRMGHSADFAGDVNNDGVPDIMGGAPFADSGGEVLNGYGAVWSGADGAVLFEVYGTISSEQFAHASLGLGDVNGDGYGDFAFGAPWARSTRVGAARAYSGFDGSLLWTKSAAEAWSATGYRLASAGDLDGDKIDDVIVAAHGVNPFVMAASRGRVSVVSGSNGAELLTFVNTPTTDPHELFGFAVAGLGDIDGDGKPDLAVGVPYADANNLLESGTVFVYSGGTGEQLYAWHGSRSNEKLGRALAGPGDVDGDGVPDIAMGSGHLGPFRPHYGRPFEAGTCYVRSGATGKLLGRYDGVLPCDASGTFLGAVGDVNGDGLMDIGTGMPYYDPACGGTYPGSVLIFGY